jgi:hypothetical protein
MNKDWFGLAIQFRISKSHRDAVLKNWQETPQSLLVKMIEVLKVEKDEILKITLLTLLQENTRFFLGEDTPM